jgi:hypothetical protein
MLCVEPLANADELSCCTRDLVVLSTLPAAGRNRDTVQIRSNIVRTKVVGTNIVRSNIVADLISAPDDDFANVALSSPGNQPVTEPTLPSIIEGAGRLFEPFVSSKRDGMRFGLSISPSIIEAQDGHFVVEPNPGGGSVFRFRLPSSGVVDDD